MNGTLLAWIVAAPLLAGAIALLVARQRGRASTVILLVCTGLLAQMALTILAEGDMYLPGIELRLAISAPAKLGMLAASAALVCSLFYSWHLEPEDAARSLAWCVPLTSSLLATALLSQEGMVSAICLLGVALAITAAAFGSQATALLIAEDDDEARTWLARRIAGGLKHLALAVIGVGLLVTGTLLLARYTFNLENRGFLQLGVGLLAMGLIIRVGAMPFSSAFNDLVEATPGLAIQMLGAVTPGVLMVGLLILGPVESSLVNPSSVAWLAAISALLAGVRALSGAREANSGEQRSYGIATLIAATASLQIAWALFGLLTGARSGAMGAALLAANIALAVPLLVASSRWSGAGASWGRIGTSAAVLSLLGLPPFGGFIGTLFIAQAATNISGLWLAVLLLGSALVAVAWLRLRRPRTTGNEETPAPARGSSMLIVLIVVLICSQVALLALSGRIIAAMAAWGSVPWLSAP